MLSAYLKRLSCLSAYWFHNLAIPTDWWVLPSEVQFIIIFIIVLTFLARILVRVVSAGLLQVHPVDRINLRRAISIIKVKFELVCRLAGQ